MIFEIQLFPNCQRRILAKREGRKEKKRDEREGEKKGGNGSVENGSHESNARERTDEREENVCVCKDLGDVCDDGVGDVGRQGDGGPKSGPESGPESVTPPWRDVA